MFFSIIRQEFYTQALKLLVRSWISNHLSEKQSTKNAMKDVQTFIMTTD